MDMAKLIVEGLHKLNGAVGIHGAKNSALPVLAATLLANSVSEIGNCPRLSDVDASVAILRCLGCQVDVRDHVVTVDPAGMCRCEIPDHLMREMRSSIVFLGAIIAKCGEARMSFPGGCELGPRPIDLHLDALEKLLAAATADGTTVLHNAAREPEIEDLCGYLNACGARIAVEKDGVITIEGVEALHGCRHEVIPDRIETATYMAAAAVTGGTLLLRSARPEHVNTVFPAFEEAGCQVSVWKDEILISAPSRLRRVKTIRTMPYPGFPTDAQAPLMAMACLADGTSVFIETIFENRYKHAGELMRLGAKIKVEGRVAVVEGVPMLSGAPVECTDLRGGAALVVAALAAEGHTEITCLTHLDRGYEELEDCLARTGAVIRRE